MVRNMKLFQIPDLRRAEVHLAADIGDAYAAFIHHNEEMVEYIVDLTDQSFFVAVFGGNDRFGTFFSHLFQNLIKTLLKQVTGIRSLLWLCAPLCNDRFHLFKTIHDAVPPLIHVKKQLLRPVWQVGPSG